MLSIKAPVFVPPTVAAPIGTLLDVATILEGVEWLEPIGLFESYSCLDASTAATFPCPASFLAAPVMGSTSTATTGGTLAAGTYRAKVTAVNDRGETIASAEASQVTTGAASTVTFNWAEVTGEAKYRLYLTNGATGSEDRYVEIPANTHTYVLTAWPPSGAVTGVSVPTQNTAVVSVTKTAQSPNWQDGIRFAVYSAFDCKAPGRAADTMAQVQAAFLRRESVGVERAIMQNRFVDGGTFNWDAATNVTPSGGPVSPDVGLALLEGAAAESYGGVPVIHAPRAVASLLTRNSQVARAGDHLVTSLGSPVAAGGGYSDPNNGPDGDAPDDGTYWMYASGAVTVARGELFVHEEVDRSTNEVFTLVERLYVATVDCFTAAVNVKVE